MNKILQLSLISLITMIFVACGGGGGGSTDTSTEVETPSNSDSSSINITIACTTTSGTDPSTLDLATYYELQSGDIIVEDEEDTIVQIYTPADGNSRVCLESGVAHIQRN